MLTSINPRIKFTDGKATIVGSYGSITKSSKIKVHIPTLMSEIPMSKYPSFSSEMLGIPEQIFVNQKKSMPKFSASIGTQNFITVDSSEAFVTQESNKEMKRIADAMIPPHYIEFLPLSAPLSIGPGQEVLVKSDTNYPVNMYIQT